MGFLPGSPLQTLPPPPSVIPPFPIYPTYIVDCTFRYTYVWLWNGEGFWFYPSRVEYGIVTGLRWNGQFWFNYSIDPNFIRAVSCAPIPTLY
jgi:hypothetical protein